MKQFTAYLAILLFMLILYHTYETFKVKEGHKIDRMWHTDEKTGIDGVKHSHPLAWATNKPGKGKVDYIADSGYTIPESVTNAENNGYTCSPIETDHHQMVMRETPSSPIGDGLDDEGSYTTSTSDGTLITGDATTEEWKNTLEGPDYTYPDKRLEFWNKVQKDYLGDGIANYSQKYTLMNIVSNIIGGKLSSYDYHIDKAKTEKYLAFYSEKTGKPTSTICNHYHSSANQLNEILNIENGYHDGSNQSLKSKNPTPCNVGEDGDCIYGWKENSLAEWRNIHEDIKVKIRNKCS